MSFTLYAFQRETTAPDSDLYRRRLPRQLLGEAVGWALDHGSDTIVINLNDETAFRPEIVHHCCADAACPGGCG